MKTHALVLLATVAFGLPACTGESEEMEEVDAISLAASGNQNGENGVYGGFLKGKNRVKLFNQNFKGVSNTFRTDLLNRSLNNLTTGIKELVCGTTQDNTESLEVLDHVVQCALKSTRKITFTCPQNSSKTIELKGHAGIHDAWASGSCDITCQQKVSACLIAGTNFVQEHINIDLASDTPAMGPLKKASGFSHEEGAYWGNVFKAVPEIYGCYAPDAREYTYFSTANNVRLELMARTCLQFSHGVFRCLLHDGYTEYLGNIDSNNEVRACDDNNICNKNPTTSNYTNCKNNAGTSSPYVITVRHKDTNVKPKSP